MANSSRDREREWLEQELRSAQHHQRLRWLQRKAPFLRQFRTWADVIAFMRNGTSTDPRKDEILRPIFEAHAQEDAPCWRAILLAIFWPGLESIHVRKRHWDPDPDERWQNVVWTFLHVLCRVDVTQRPNRLVQKVYNDTVHHLYDDYRRAWDRTNRECYADPEEIDALIGGVEEIDVAGIERREAQRIEIERLRAHMDAGRITTADGRLLIGTRVYGTSVADYARETGVAYQVAKKRRQRAEAAIGRFEKEQR